MYFFDKIFCCERLDKLILRNGLKKNELDALIVIYIQECGIRRHTNACNFLNCLKYIIRITLKNFDHTQKVIGNCTKIPIIFNKMLWLTRCLRLFSSSTIYFGEVLTREALKWKKFRVFTLLIYSWFWTVEKFSTIF